MAKFRDTPYAQFNFLIELGDGDPSAVAGGFSECSGLSLDVDVVEYRNGNEKTNAVRKLPGLHKVGDVTLKRGVIGSLDLFEWVKQLCDGVVDLRNVRIQLLTEDHNDVALTFLLRNARPARYVVGPLRAMGTDVAMEELTLAYERLEIE